MLQFALSLKAESRLVARLDADDFRDGAPVS
jgi:hypothetical protein